MKWRFRNSANLTGKIRESTQFLPQCARLTRGGRSEIRCWTFPDFEEH